MDEMKRTVTLLVALGYGLSFVIVCLSACLMGPMAADHACCADDEGIRAAGQDCCSVTPGVAHAGGPMVTALPAVAGAVPSPHAILEPAFAPRGPAGVSLSPPLVLRV